MLPALCCCAVCAAFFVVLAVVSVRLSLSQQAARSAEQAFAALPPAEKIQLLEAQIAELTHLIHQARDRIRQLGDHAGAMQEQAAVHRAERATRDQGFLAVLGGRKAQQRIRQQARRENHREAEQIAKARQSIGTRRRELEATIRRSEEQIRVRKEQVAALSALVRRG